MSTRSDSSGVTRREFLRMTALAVGGLALAACTPQAAPTAPATEPTAVAVSEPTAAVAPAPKEPVSIRMITHWTGEDAHTKTMQLLYARFQEANADVKLDIVEIPDWGQADAKTQSECSAGNCPDVAFDGFNNAAVVDAGLVHPADDFVAKHKDVIDMDYLGAQYKGHYWRAFSEELNCFCVIYSRELLAEIGFDEFPKTWEGLLKAGEAVKAKGKALTTFHAYWPWLFGWVQASTEDGAKAMETGDWDSPTWMQTMESFARLVPYLAPDELEMSDAIAPLRVRDGEMLFYTDGQWMIGNTGLEPAAAAEKFGCTAFPTPAGRTAAGFNSYAIGNTAYVHADKPEKEQAAWRFLDFWCTDEEVIRSFIVDSQSPMGVRTDLVTPELAGPFLPQFVEAIRSADRAHVESGVWATSDTWGAVLPGFEALTVGKSPAEATAIMMEIIKGG